MRRRRERLSRRRFLQAAGGGAALAFPALAAAQGPIGMRWQSAWPAKDLFHEFALDFARRVGDMTGGELRIEMLPADATTRAAGLLEAVGKGALDGSHGLLSHHYARHPALALWSSGPAFGMDANTLLAWHKYGGGKALLARVYEAIGAPVVPFLYGPMPTQPLGWFKKRLTRPQDLAGMALRVIGAPGELYAALGATVSASPAAEPEPAVRAALDGVEFNNPTSDRALGLPGVAPVYMLQSYHQNSEQFEVLVNRARFEALPPKLRAVLESAVEASSADMAWKAIERYARDYDELLKEGVRSYRTPDALLRRQLEAHDALAGPRRADALFREVEDSQRQFARRAVRWQLDAQISPRLAYEHYFDSKPTAKGTAGRTPKKKR